MGFPIVLTLVCRSIVNVEGANPLDEALHAALLEDAHQGGLEGLASIRGDLGDSGLGAGTLLHKAPCDLLELEVSGDIGGDEDVGQLAGGHEELGDQVDVPVVRATVFLPWLVALAVVAVLLEELQARCVRRPGCARGYIYKVVQEHTVSRLTDAASLCQWSLAHEHDRLGESLAVALYTLHTHAQLGGREEEW